MCEIDGEIVDYEHIAKAYVDGDQTVILTDDDLASLPAERSKDIDVVEFVPSDQVDPIMFEKSYYLAPDSKSTKAYVLLMRTLEETDRTAIVQFALRQKTRLAALRVRDDVLMLQTLLWDDEVREARFPELDEAPTITAAELKMSRQLVESFASDFTPEKFTDDYQEQLRTLVEAKLEQGDALDTEATFGAREPRAAARCSTSWRRCAAASRSGAGRRPDEEEGAREEGPREEEGFGIDARVSKPVPPGKLGAVDSLVEPWSRRALDPRHRRRDLGADAVRLPAARLGPPGARRGRRPRLVDGSRTRRRSHADRDRHRDRLIDLGRGGCRVGLVLPDRHRAGARGGDAVPARPLPAADGTSSGSRGAATRRRPGSRSPTSSPCRCSAG